ncbi:hypothetical protein HNQ96_000542 [Aminobacter lissarensis]|uniref:Uncharacterized protein n=1 Tax=Aminobacter carboxidus TaxID=376165 RepID=A0A8E2BCF3_9HYPH|nr:hypothetical protein [Aminobacter lissarensis]
MPLTLDIPGASPDEIQRGLAAAQAILDMHGVSPKQGAHSTWKVENAQEPLYSLDGEDLAPTKEDEKTAEIWYRAQAAAVNACHEGWARQDDPHYGSLGCSRD